MKLMRILVIQRPYRLVVYMHFTTHVRARKFKIANSPPEYRGRSAVLDTVTVFLPSMRTSDTTLGLFQLQETAFAAAVSTKIA